MLAQSTSPPLPVLRVSLYLVIRPLGAGLVAVMPVRTAEPEIGFSFRDYHLECSIGGKASRTLETPLRRGVLREAVLSRRQLDQDVCTERWDVPHGLVDVFMLKPLQQKLFGMLLDRLNRDILHWSVLESFRVDLLNGKSETIQSPVLGTVDFEAFLRIDFQELDEVLVCNSEHLDVQQHWRHVGCNVGNVVVASAIHVAEHSVHNCRFVIVKLNLAFFSFLRETSANDLSTSQIHMFRC